MKHKHQKYTENQNYPSYEFQKDSPSQAIKSPSPDKKRSKMITPTKSPQLIDIKRNLVQSRFQDKRFEKTPVDMKPFEQSTRYYTNDDFQEYRSSQKKNEVLQQLQNMMPEQFMLQSSHQYKSATSPNSKQLDYIKLLQQKQRTIKQLHQIIEMINRNNSLQLSSSSVSGTKHKRIFDNSNKSVFSNKSNEPTSQKQLKNQVRILTIQNQQLIHMIQKLNQEKRSYEDLQKNLKKQHIDYTAHRMKEEILSREIYEMKESLIQKDFDYDMLSKENKDLYSKYLQLDQENQKLIKMMKDKELSDRKYHSSLIESNISQKSSISESQAKQKLSIQKIKEQYNESLKVFKDTVYGDVQQFMREIGNNIKGLQNKLVQMEQQVQTLEKFKSAYENLRKQKMPQTHQKPEKHQLHQISQIQIVSPQKEHYRQIESLLMEKTELYQKELETQRQSNEELNKQLNELTTKHQLLQDKYSQLLEENTQIRQKAKQQLSQSQKRNVEQIEDINQAKAKQAEIQKLSELIEKCQTDFHREKERLVSEINLLKAKNQSYEQIIESQKQQFEQKQMDVKTRISQKQHQLRRNSSKYQSEIDHLRQLLSQKQLNPPQAQPLTLESQIQDLKQSIQLKQVQIQQKSGQIIELQQKLEQMQETLEFTRQEIKKLMQNYEKEINILRAGLSVQKQKHQSQVEDLNSQLRRVISQSQNTEQLLLQSQSNSNQQVTELKQRIFGLEKQLNAKNRQSRELLHSKQTLQVEHSQLKQNLEQLLVISKQVEQLQQENKSMRQKIFSSQSNIIQLQQTISHQSLLIRDHQESSQSLRQSIKKLSKQRQNQHQTISNLQQQLNQLQSKLVSVRKQSQDRVNQKDIELAVEIQRYQEEKVQYEFIVKQLKQEVSNLNQDLDLLRQESLTYQQSYNHLLTLRQPNLLNQLYQLRSLLNKSHDSQTDTQTNYDLGKICIEFHSKIDENQHLHSRMDELRQQAKKSAQQRILLQEKITFLEKNISIYQNQLKERKNFCQKLIVEKTKLQKELLLIKKLKIQSKQEEADSVKLKLLQRVNNLVRFQENRESEIKRFAERRAQSPIRQINSLISKVQEFDTFSIKKSEYENQ